MNGKQRVHETLNFRKTDRPARFLWFSTELSKKLGGGDLGERYGNDIVQPWLSQNRGMAVLIGEGERYTDDWGIVRERVHGYNTTVCYPIEGVKDMDAYKVPNPLDENRFAELDAMLKSCGDELFVGADMSPTLFEASYNLVSMEKLMFALADGEAPMIRLLDRLMEFCIKASCRAARMGADWIWLGDDLGTQQGMLISPDMFREYLKPRYKTIIEEIRKERKDIFIAFHSCGAMAPVIGDLAEVGVDVLNPVQESAKGMSQREIKGEFGGRLSLMCGLDTQSFLLFATPDEVVRRTNEVCDALVPGGGFIFGASHTIQDDTSRENIESMVSALDHYDGGL